MENTRLEKKLIKIIKPTLKRLQKTGFFDLVQSSEGLQQYLEKAGIWMPILYIALQFLQVIILPIPGIVSTMAGVTLFGPFKTLIYSLIGILLGSLTAFFIGRKLGNKAVEWIVGKETLKKWQKKYTLFFISVILVKDEERWVEICQRSNLWN